MSHNDTDSSIFLGRITEIIKSNLKNEQFGVSLLAREMGMSRSNLHRKIKAETGKSVSQFINRVRLTYALELLQKPGMTVSEAAYESGFHSVTYFSTCFHEFYGYSPGKATGNTHLPDEPNKAKAEMPVNGRNIKKRRMQFLYLFVLPVLVTALIVIFFDVPVTSSGSQPVTIAVLPQETGTAYSSGQTLVNAVMFQIIKNLSEIENFEVGVLNIHIPDQQFMSAEPDKIKNADYILESKIISPQKIAIVLKNGVNGEVELSESYVATHEIFNPAAQIASEIAASINRNLSDEEKIAFEKAPSANPNALLNYQLGLNYKSIAGQGMSSEHLENLLKAKNLFEEAIKMDSSFTEAYIELGHVYINNMYYSAGTMQEADQYLESGHQLVNKALELDEGNKEALNLLGRYCLRKGNKEQASRIFAGLSRNTGAGYQHFINEFDVSVHYEDYCNAVQNFFYYEEKNPADALIPKYMLNNVALIFSDTGFPEVAREYARKLLTNYNDSLQFYMLMGTVEMRAGNYRRAIEWHLKTAGEREFASGSYHFFKFNSILMGDLVNAGRYLERWEAVKKDEIRYPGQYYIAGMICRRTRQEEKALAYFKAAEKNLLEAVNRKTRRSQIYVEQFYLAGVYFELDETSKAIKYLSMLKERKTIPHWIVLGFETWPPLTERRNIPEIEDIYQNLLVKFNQEHNRIGKLLVSEGIVKQFVHKTATPE